MPRVVDDGGLLLSGVSGTIWYHWRMIRRSIEGQIAQQGQEFELN
jgi:hypothetical protein